MSQFESVEVQSSCSYPTPTNSRAKPLIMSGENDIPFDQFSMCSIDYDTDEKQALTTKQDVCFDGHGSSVEDDDDDDKDEKEETCYHYEEQRELSKSLQGSVYLAKMTNLSQDFERSVVIKSASKRLHKQSVALLPDGKCVKIEENIVEEARIMHRLSQEQPPSTMIGFIDFQEDDANYYLVMEDGGSSFFDFILQCHAYIEQGKLSVAEWRNQCKFMFAQMVSFQRWMHRKGFVNLDISLENMLISHDWHFDEESGKMSGCHLKFIDFGLSAYFPEKEGAKCAKYVGKSNYKAPKVYRQEPFDPRKADIWSLGVVLFMMTLGCQAYKRPIESDPEFARLKKGKLLAWVKQIGRLKYLNISQLDLLSKLLTVDESKRPTMDEVCQHAFICRYFDNESAK